MLGSGVQSQFNSREISQNISTGGLTKRLCGKARSSVADVYSKMAQLQFL